MGLQMTVQTQAILSVLLGDAAGRHYGLEIAQAAGIATGSLYPALARLEREGWVTSSWEQIDQHRRPPETPVLQADSSRCRMRGAGTGRYDPAAFPGSRRSGPLARRRRATGGCAVSIIVLFLSLVFIPLLVGEVTGWLPWLTSQVVRASTRRLPAAERERYAEEWQAELKAWPGGDLTRLLFAVRIFVSARDTCRALDGEAVQLVTPKLKATFDRTLAFCALLLLSPVMTAIAVAIKVGDGGPVLFSQIRVGVDGSTFKIFRFRTLVSGEQQKALLAVKNEGGGVVFTIRADPRITRVGRWLRRWSLDELPQLFNVLAGEMSLVGPRPGAAGRSCALRGEGPPQAGCTTGCHRPVANHRALRHVLGGSSPARYSLRRELVTDAGSANPVADLVGRWQRDRRLRIDPA